MITDIPSIEDFEQLGLECITHAFETLETTADIYSNCSGSAHISSVLSEDEFWINHYITVKTSFIIMYQGIEYLMKMTVASESPLLLIEANKSQWPSLPQKKNKRFDELTTISGENLLNVFGAIVNENINLQKFIDRFNLLRIKRNKLVHSTGVNGLNYKDVIKEIIFFLALFYPEQEWLNHIRNKYTNQPTLGFYDFELESVYFYTSLDFLRKCITKKELSSYLGIDLSSKAYRCPKCSTILLKQDLENHIPHWSFIIPKSNILKCFICNKSFQASEIPK